MTDDRPDPRLSNGPAYLTTEDRATLRDLHEDIDRLLARVAVTLKTVEDVLEEAKGVRLWP